MKKTLITLALVAVSAAAFAQGKVAFGNDATHLYNIGTPAAGDVSGAIPVSPLASGQTLTAVLYAGTSAGSLSLQTSYALSAANWLTDGRMVTKSVILTGIPGGAVANFQIFITDLGATLPGTIVGGGVAGFSGMTYFGTSGLFTATPGGSLSYPGLVSGGPAGSTWAGPIGVNAVPEPSSMVLAGLGAASLLMFRRRS